jgi:enoyl-CoA hydratase/carnithine racemase
MLALGVVTEVVDDGVAVDAACTLAGQLAKGPETAIADIKTLLNQAESATFEDQLINERDAMAKALGGDDAQVGINAFLHKRAPVFRQG